MLYYSFVLSHNINELELFKLFFTTYANHIVSALIFKYNTQHNIWIHLPTIGNVYTGIHIRYTILLCIKVILTKYFIVSYTWIM